MLAVYRIFLFSFNLMISYKHRFTLFILAFFLLLSFNFHSQQAFSLDINNQASLSLEKWNRYLRNNLDSLKIDALNLLQHSNINNNLFAISVAKRSMGSFFIRKGYPSKGRDYLKNSLAYFEKMDDKTLAAETLSEIGISFFVENDYYEAKNYFEQSLKCASESKDITISFMSEINLAQVYGNLGDHVKATSYANHYLRQCLHHNKLESASNALAFLGTYEINNNRLFLAKEYLLKSYEYALQSTSKIQISLAYNNLGVWFATNNDFENAKTYFIKSLTIRKEINSPKQLFESYYNLAEVYLLINDFDQSIQMYNLALSLTMENHLFNEEVECWNGLSNICEIKKDFKNASLYKDTLIQRISLNNKLKIKEYQQLRNLVDPIQYNPPKRKLKHKEYSILIEFAIVGFAVLTLILLNSKLKIRF